MSANRKSYTEVTPFITKDGSIIRELMHPNQDPVKGHSVAEAIVHQGMSTFLHRHVQSEEVYYILQGQGLMRLGEEQFTVKTGDVVFIPPGTPHSVLNNGDADLKILCSSSPPYHHHDTQLLTESIP